MGCLPHRSLSTVLTATILTTVAIAQPVLFLKQAAIAQEPDAASEIEFIPPSGSPEAVPPNSGNQVITAPQGSFGRGGQVAVPSPPSSSPDAPLATSTFSSDRSQTAPNPEAGVSNAIPAGQPPIPQAPVNQAPVNQAPTNPVPASVAPPAPTVSQAVPDAVPPLGDTSSYNYSTSAPTESEALPVIPVPAQPVAPQPAPNLASGTPSQPDVPTSYDYRRPSAGAPSSPTFVASGQLPGGTIIPLATFRDTKFTQGQQLQVNLSVAQDVVDSQGRTIVPAGSTVWGRFEPIMEESTDMVGSYERTRERMVGSQFIAERIDIQSASHTISGRTNRIPAGIDPDADVDRVALRNAGYGVLGGVALGVLTGGAGFLPLMAIGGAGGAMAGTVSVSNVVSIDGDTILELTLDQPFISS
ncbi:MAG: hypothetical protein AB4050_10875 [Synechococcus sp.]